MTYLQPAWPVKFAMFARQCVVDGRDIRTEELFHLVMAEVVMGEFEFPTMGQVWLAQQPRGAEIRFLAAQNGRIPAEAYAGVVDAQTLIVPLTHMCFMNGFRSDPAAVAKIAHDNGALVMLDDYQDCGTRPINVKKLDLDFYVTGALKYLLSPSARLAAHKTG